MPNHERATCWNCGQHRSEVGPISWSGLCEQCSLTRLEDNVWQMYYKNGPNWMRRTAGMVRYAQRLLLDARPAEGQTHDQ